MIVKNLPNVFRIRHGPVEKNFNGASWHFPNPVDPDPYANGVVLKGGQSGNH